MKVSLISKTVGVGDFESRTIDEMIVGIARISSSRDDLFASPEKLLRYCILNQHWSILEQIDLGFQIETSRAIAHQIIRHKSLCFQEFSLRYAEAIDVEDVEIREQSKSNRQSSSIVINPEIDNRTADTVFNDLFCQSLGDYTDLISAGVAKEIARFILPLATKTKLNASGNLRSWITFLNARLHHTAQKEIRLVAEEISKELIKQCPLICKCFFDFENAYNIHFLERLVLEKYGVYNQVIGNLRITD